nr:alpha/beta hydrolase-fold protein [Endozoicomonas sp. G2_2]
MRVASVGLALGVVGSVQARTPAGFDITNVVDRVGGETYQLLVSRPTAPPPPAGYPAIYLLDGNATAPLARQWLADHGLAGRVLVVGIGYPDTDNFNIPRRFVDLTPVSGAEHAGSGRADAFLDFVARQVRRRIAERFALDEARQALYGHSLGGLTVLAQLVRDPTAFSAYFAASPSLWWGEGAFKPRLAAFAAGGCGEAAQSQQVTLTVGRNEQPVDRDVRARLGKARVERLATRRMVDNTRWAARELRRCGGLDVAQRVLAQAGHRDALRAGLFAALDRWLGDAPRGTNGN